LEAVKWLVEAGKADIDRTNLDGKTASEVTREGEISSYLVNQKLSIKSWPESAKKR